MTDRPIDPVCGMPVSPEEGAFTAEHDGRVYRFCSRACRDRFVAAPGATLGDLLYDLVILGAGPAGLSAGIFASLAGIDTLLLTRSIGGQAWGSTEVLNYPGFDLITGPELVKRFQRQAFESPHLFHRIADLQAVRRAGGGFEVTTAGGQTFRARTVLLATGRKRRRLGIPGEAELLGKGVSEFHALSAFRYAGRHVAVVGGGNSAVQAALGLAEAGARVVLTARGYHADDYLKRKVSAQPAITLLQHRSPVRIEGRQRVEALVVQPAGGGPEERLPVEAVFAEVGLVPNSDLVRGLVELNHHGEVIVDGNCRTSVPGLFAAGDVTSTFGKRILIAAADGAKAVLAVKQHLATAPAVP